MGFWVLKVIKRNLDNLEFKPGLFGLLREKYSNFLFWVILGYKEKSIPISYFGLVGEIDN
jgi:hypothetical protein